jgi:hypothetical protein
MRRIDKKTIVVYTLLIIISLAIAIYTQLPALLSPYVINDDVMQHTFWMSRFQNNALFNDYIYVEYSNFCMPIGFKFAYYVLTAFADPAAIDKIPSLILYVVSGLYIFKLSYLLKVVYCQSVR